MKGLESWWHSLPTWGKILVGVGGAFLVYMVVKGKGSSTTNTVTTVPTTPTIPTGSDVSATDNGSGYSSGSGTDGYSWLGTSSGSGSSGSSVPGSQTGVGSGIAPAPVTVTPKTPSAPAMVSNLPTSVVSQTPNDVSVGTAFHSTVVQAQIGGVTQAEKTQIANTPHTNIVNNNHGQYEIAQGGSSYNAADNAAGGQWLDHQFAKGTYNSKGQFVASDAHSAALYNKTEISLGRPNRAVFGH